MPIPLADRRGQLDAPNVQPGRAFDPSQGIENIGRISANTLKLMSKATDDMGKAVIARQRQEEQLAAQDALTEYLAGREKLDSVRNSLALENAVNFEDEYYKQAQKMHSEFVNKINKLQYADIRERVRGQANNTNIQTAAQSENFFWKQKEDVADKHTDALVDAKIRSVVNGVNSNPGMASYNQGNIANGYMFVLDTLKNRLIEKGYRDGSEEMNLAMAQAKDRYFTQVLEEISHRPDNGLSMAHSLGKVFKQQMSPEAYNKVMKPIGQNNLALELTRDASRFFKNGDVLSGEPDDAKAAEFAQALDPWERLSFLKAFQEKSNQGHNSEKAARDVDYSREFVARAGEWAMGNLGSDLGLIPGMKELEKLSPEDTKKIAAQIRQNANVKDVANQLALWAHAVEKPIYVYKLEDGKTAYARDAKTGKRLYGDVEPIALSLTNEDKDLIRNRVSVLKALLFNDPEIRQKGLKATWFEGKKPDVQEVALAAVLQQAYDSSKKKTWYSPINFFNIFGEEPVGSVGYTEIGDLVHAVLSSTSEYGNTAFDDLSSAQQREVWQKISRDIESNVEGDYVSKFSANGLQKTYGTGTERIIRDIRGRNTSLSSPLGIARVFTAAELAALYNGARTVSSLHEQFIYKQGDWYNNVKNYVSMNQVGTDKSNFTDLKTKIGE